MLLDDFGGAKQRLLFEPLGRTHHDRVRRNKGRRPAKDLTHPVRGDSRDNHIGVGKRLLKIRRDLQTRWKGDVGEIHRIRAPHPQVADESPVASP